MESVLLDLFVRSLAVLAGVGLLALAVRRFSAATRSLVWRLGIGLLLALPVMAAVLPKWTIAVLPPAEPVYRYAADSGAAVAPFPWLAAIYAVGVALGLIRLASSFFAAALVVRRGIVVERTEDYRVILSKDAPMPFAYGLLKPAVVLPTAALDWDPAVQADVVAHEAAHIARQDWLWLLLGRISAVFYWPNLAVAWMLHRARLDAEMAADDRVVSQGQDQVVYAEHLVRVARACQSTVLLAPMAAEPPLTARLRSLLGAGVHRNTPGRPATHAAFVLALLLIGPSAALGFGRQRVAVTERPVAKMPAQTVNTSAWVPPAGAAQAAAPAEVAKTEPEAQAAIDVAPNATTYEQWTYPSAQTGTARASGREAAAIPMPTYIPPNPPAQTIQSGN